MGKMEPRMSDRVIAAFKGGSTHKGGQVGRVMADSAPNQGQTVKEPFANLKTIHHTPGQASGGPSGNVRKSVGPAAGGNKGPAFGTGHGKSVAAQTPISGPQVAVGNKGASSTTKSRGNSSGGPDEADRPGFADSEL